MTFKTKRVIFKKISPRKKVIVFALFLGNSKETAEPDDLTKIFDKLSKVLFF